MSANNVIYINHKTLEVFYQACIDNGLNNAEKIGKGKTLDDAYKIAEKWLDKQNYFLEYGIQII